MADLNINIRVTSESLRWAAAALLLCAGVIELGSESLTLSTYYPAPSGIYARMITTGDTFLARDAGGKVGIGTTGPTSLLDVNGPAQLRGSPGGGGLYVDFSGRVGIGTTSPQAGLAVANGVVQMPSYPAAQEGALPKLEGALYYQYDQTNHKFRAFENGQWTDLCQAGGSASAHGSQLFTSDGDFTVPPNVTRLRVEVYGGGGGGCGSYGGYGSTAGGRGGTSSFGSYVSATGGYGGIYNSSSGGDGGVGVNGDLNFTGGAVKTYTDGRGGAAGGGSGGVNFSYGGGGGSAGNPMAGSPGGLYGGGGGGAYAYGYAGGGGGGVAVKSITVTQGQPSIRVTVGGGGAAGRSDYGAWDGGAGGPGAVFVSW